MSSPPHLERLWAALAARALRAGLERRVALLAMVLASPCLALGFYLDDHVGRYIYSDEPAAARLFEVLAGGYGLARGNAAELHWQIEQGYAPWWAPESLRLVLWRPLGVWFHRLDMSFGPLLQHAHSWLWLGVLVLVTAHLYRRLLGRTVGGVAALLFALDHSHGFIVGYISNRYALLAGVVSVIGLERHARARERDRIPVAAPLLFGAALLAGECSLSLAGYIAAYTVFVDAAPRRRRALAVVGYVVVLLAWRAAYSRGGFGAASSGLYLDPAREPLRFLEAFGERAPPLMLGQFLLPPAEVFQVVSPALARGLYTVAVVATCLLFIALLPLLRRERPARFWAAGMVLSLIPAASTYPHNRQLLFASFGAMALIAQLWQLHVATRVPASNVLWLSRACLGPVLLIHLFVSPLLQPLTTCGIAAARPLQRGSLASLGDDIGGRDVVFVNAPDYFATKLPQLARRLGRHPLPRRWRALYFGPEPVTLARVDARTLELAIPGGALTHPFLELYRDRRLRMIPGERVALTGLDIVVASVTSDGRLSRARFEFDTSLDMPSFKLLQWKRGAFAPFAPPPVGATVALEPARLTWGL